MFFMSMLAARVVIPTSVFLDVGARDILLISGIFK